MAVLSSSMALFGLFVALGIALIFGQDSPLTYYDTIPTTQFTCQDKKYGYYADLEAGCQVFHVCLNNQKWSFLCPNQTVFNQHYLVCDHPYNVPECLQSEQFLWVNDNFFTDKQFLQQRK